MRALNASQAGRCETATTPRCKCRCGGQFHGAKRVTAAAVDQLPLEDPHRPGAADRRPQQLTLQAPTRIYGAAPRTR